MGLTPIPKTNNQVFTTYMPGRFAQTDEDKLCQRQQWTDAYHSHKIRYIVLLCPDKECEQRLNYNLREYYLECKFKVIHFPLLDRELITKDQSYDSFIDRVFQKYKKGHHIVIHCSSGMNRTGTVIESLQQKILANKSSEPASSI